MFGAEILSLEEAEEVDCFLEEAVVASRLEFLLFLALPATIPLGNSFSTVGGAGQFVSGRVLCTFFEKIKNRCGYIIFEKELNDLDT